MTHSCAVCPADAVVQWGRRCLVGVEAVFACLAHAINADLASRVHSADCLAPDPKNLPSCGCTLEPHPEPPAPVEVTTTSTGWIVPVGTPGA
jgi:hypothetical protein